MRDNTWLSNSASPFLRREGLLDLLRGDDRKRVVQVPADAASLRELRAVILRIASLDYGKGNAFAHVVPTALRRQADHLIGIHLMGYVHNEEGKPDDEGDAWTWRTGLGSYSSDPLRPWTTNVQDAIFLASLTCPDLRMSLRVGGRRNGQPERAWFSRKPEVASLSGAHVPLDLEWPRKVRDFPAVAIICVLLEALAMEKDAAGLAVAA